MKCDYCRELADFGLTTPESADLSPSWYCTNCIIKKVLEIRKILRKAKQ